MKRKRKIDSEYIVHWILAISIALGVIGAIIQIIRFGGLVEPGNTGDFGAINQPSIVAQSRSGVTEVR